MWDNYWLNLPNITTCQLQIHRKQRLYLGVEPDVVINNCSIYKDDNDNKANSEGPLPLPINDKQITHTSSKHGTQFLANISCIVPEKERISLSRMGMMILSLPFTLVFLLS